MAEKLLNHVNLFRSARLWTEIQFMILSGKMSRYNSHFVKEIRIVIMRMLNATMKNGAIKRLQAISYDVIVPIMVPAPITSVIHGSNLA